MGKARRGSGINGCLFLSRCRGGGCWKPQTFSRRSRCKLCDLPITRCGRCGYCYNRLNRFDELMRSARGSVIQLDKPTSMPKSPSRLKKRLGSKALLRACSAPIQSDQRLDSFKESDQTRDSEFSSEENLSSEIVTTSMPPSPSSIAKQLPSISKKPKREALDKKKKKKKKKKAESTT